MRQNEWFVKKHEPGLDERFRPIEMIPTHLNQRL